MTGQKRAGRTWGVTGYGICSARMRITKYTIFAVEQMDRDGHSQIYGKDRDRCFFMQPEPFFRGAGHIFLLAPTIPSLHNSFVGPQSLHTPTLGVNKYFG